MASYSWIIGNGNWSTAAKWSPAGTPGSSDQATISATGSNYVVTVNSADAANSLTLSSANATINDTGTSLAAAASLTIGTTVSLSAGTITIGAYGTMSVGGAFTMTGGKINVNSGGTLSGGALTQSAGAVTLNAGGTIANATIDVTGGTFNWAGGTLSGDKFEGTLNLTAASSYGHVANGLTMAGSNGTGNGTINVTGASSTLYFDDTQTVDNATINLGKSGNTDYLYEYDTTGTGNVLTLGSGVIVNATGNSYIGYYFGYSGDGIVNQGQINQTGGLLTISESSFTNSGAIDVSGGGAVYIQPTTFKNLASHTLTGGTYEAEAGSTLQVTGGASITTLNANVILSGLGSQFLDYYTGASSAGVARYAAAHDRRDGRAAIARRPKLDDRQCGDRQ